MAGMLTVDIGSSSVKGGVFDADGTLLGYFHESLPSDEQSRGEPQAWIDAMQKGIRTVKDASRISSVTVSGHGPTIVPVFQDDTWEIAELWYTKTASSQYSGRSYFIPKILNIREQRPELFESAAAFLTCPGFISWMLCGEKAAVSPHSEFDALYWDTREAEALGIDPEKLPSIRYSGEEIGRVSSRGGDLFGVPAGIPVYGGGLDYLMALLGTGTVEVGSACDRAGTSEGINFCSSTAVAHPSLRTLPHVIEGRYHVSGILASTGRVFEWFRTVTGQSNRSYISMMEEIRDHRPESVVPKFFPSSRHGATWEFVSGMFCQLEPSHTGADMGRAVVEAIGFGIRDVLSVLDSAGCRIEKLYGSGGQMRNPVWTQMKADIIGVPVYVPHIIDAELLGCLCCALKGAGRFTSVEEASVSLVRYDRIYEPRKEYSQLYLEKYEEYRRERDRVISKFQ